MKKKVVLVIGLIVLLSLGGCLYYTYNVKGNFLETNNKDTSEKVSMIIKEGTTTSATVVIRNRSNKELTSGAWFRIDELENDGNWKKVKTINDKYGFIAIAWIINPQGEFEDKLEWSKLYGRLRKGHYRIVKEVYYNGNKIELYAEFDIK